MNEQLQKLYNEQLSLVFSFNIMINNGTGVFEAVRRISKLAEDYKWSEQEIEALLNSLELFSEYDKSNFSRILSFPEFQK